ncbi:MAG: Asp-tRNA(Asn)/Glu-tRNA(Gln) amidotransferase subunit GatA [Candidatus Pacebacteria bacterium]|nr:Asp-tRNA(Asn)/Glu-tRNA(Gln) amidotransferase subunit GatA [Candidatus Paceibacterota bacterium]
MKNLAQLTITEAIKMLRSGETTSRAITEACLKEITERNGEINAYLEVFEDALAQSDAADARLKAGEGVDKKTGEMCLPLLGIPLAIKDNILIKGRRAGAASKILEGYIAPYNATAISKLIDQGAVFMGRTNMDEFAMGGSTENSAYGPTKNPHDLSRVSGGSSGGSVAAVAMHGCLAAIGSDTGGSVRQPASFCGMVGLKPTYGNVSRHGLMAMGSSLDVIGPVAKSVEDAKIIYDVIKGHCEMDSTSLPDILNEASNKNSQKGSPAKKMTLGIVPELMNMGGIDPGVSENFKNTVEALKKMGHTIVDISLPNIGHSLPVYYIVMPAEVSSNMARFDGMKFGQRVEGDNLLADYMNTRGQLLGKEVRRRIILGTYVLSAGYADAYYNKAQSVRRLIAADFERAFQTVEAILTPTAPTPAFLIGEKSNDPLQMYLADIFTVTANLVGVPAMSVPTGEVAVTNADGSKANLPLGIQITAPHRGEEALFALGMDIEKLLK